MFTVTIATDNDAFQYDDPAAEIAALLHKLADRVWNLSDEITTGHPITLMDTNGNTVGQAVWTNETESTTDGEPCEWCGWTEHAHDCPTLLEWNEEVSSVARALLRQSPRHPYYERALAEVLIETTPNAADTDCKLYALHIIGATSTDL